MLNRNAAWRWKHGQMESLSYQALLDAAISGDGVFYCWWDPDRRNGHAFDGDIRTDVIDSTNLFVADVNSSDIQSQKYVMLAGRATVESLRREALLAGVSEKDASRIVSDDENLGTYTADLGKNELAGEEKATFLIRFFRENGEVVFEKTTKNCLIRRAKTGLRLYPVAYFHWHNAKNCFHGTASVSDMVANQKCINTAYAMALKHMQNTAFSKVIYDKTRIPEWSNEVGEAIGAVGGGTMADAVSVVGVGQMQDGYLDLITDVIENTKSMMGATDSALGDERAHNTSAILTLQSAASVSLEHVRVHFCRCIGELAAIWADMLCTYCPTDRMLSVMEKNGDVSADSLDYTLLKNALINATVYAGSLDRYSPASTVSTLNKLLDGGHLSVAEYVELLPSGMLTNREALLEKLKEKGVATDE
ncbi:MAG: hypothetical protein IJB94_02750 [Clostridia bacterium]|nr:hypothetical protein [Clostridia bacterium]